MRSAEQRRAAQVSIVDGASARAKIPKIKCGAATSGSLILRFVKPEQILHLVKPETVFYH